MVIEGPCCSSVLAIIGPIQSLIAFFFTRRSVVFYIKRGKEKHRPLYKKYFRWNEGDQAKDEINLAGKGEKSTFQKN